VPRQSRASIAVRTAAGLSVTRDEALTGSPRPTAAPQPAAAARPAAAQPAGGRDLRAALRRLPVVWLPVLATLTLGVLGIGRPEVWRDELASWSAASRSWPDLWALLGNLDASLGAYYVLLHGWISVAGDSAAALRLPSALAMAAAAGFVVAAARRLFGTRTALVAGGIFAVTPSISRYAQEARPPALAVLAVAASTWALLVALDRGSRRWWAAYAGAVALIGWAQVIALPVLCGHAVGAALRGDARDRRRFAVAAAAGVAAVVPLVVVGLGQSSYQLDWVRPSLFELRVVPEQVFASGPVAGAVLLAAALAAVTRPRAKVALLAVSAVAPVVVVFAASLGPVSYWTPRYFLVTVPAWVILAAAGLTGPVWAAELRRRVAVAAVAAVAVLSVHAQRDVRAPGAHDAWLYPYPSGTGEPVRYSAAAAVVAAGQRSGDGIAYAAPGWWMLDLGLAYHLRDGLQPREVFAAAPPTAAGDLRPTPCQVPAACLRDEPRIWLVSPGTHADPYATAGAAEASALRSRYQVAEVHHAPGVTVALLTRRPPEP
jgi:mannosyltransferase